MSTRPVENDVITTKGLQDRNNLLLDRRTVENKGKLILSWWLYAATMLNKVRFFMGALSLIEINVCCTAKP